MGWLAGSVAKSSVKGWGLTATDGKGGSSADPALYNSPSCFVLIPDRVIIVTTPDFASVEWSLFLPTVTYAPPSTLMSCNGHKKQPHYLIAL